MNFRMLGKTGLQVSLASFGTGGPSQFGQRKGLEQKAQTLLVRKSLDLGINLFDTHEGYGESETILGNSLKGVRRDTYNICTKWSYQNPDGSMKCGSEFEESVEKSLQRLQTDYIDIMMFHGVMAEDYTIVVDSYMEVMNKLIRAGKIRFKGFSTKYVNDPAQESPPIALKTDPLIWDVLMLKYGILNQLAASETLPLAMKHSIGILNMASVRIKLPNPKLLEEPLMEWKNKGYISNNALPERFPLDWLIHDDVDSVISAAYKFAASHEAISSVIIGTSSIDHLESNIAALRNPSLPRKDYERLITLFGNIIEYA